MKKKLPTFLLFSKNNEIALLVEEKLFTRKEGSLALSSLIPFLFYSLSLCLSLTLSLSLSHSLSVSFRKRKHTIPLSLGCRRSRCLEISESVRNDCLKTNKSWSISRKWQELLEWSGE
jgi:hypothetical protein